MITSQELKKIVSSPIVWVLLILFITFNSFQIYTASYKQETMGYLNPIIEQHGALMDENGLQSLSADYNAGLQEWNALSDEANGHPYALISDFHLAENYYPAIEQNIYSHQELLSAGRLYEKEMYIDVTQEINEKYNAFSLEDLVEKYIQMYRLTGSASELARSQYESFAPRLEQLKENQEHLHLFFNGALYETHDFLFQIMFFSVMFECLLLILLITSFTMNYEFDQKTSLLAYSTKRGRKLEWNKTSASVIASMSVTALLLGSMLITYFIVFDYSSVWSSPISSGFLMESSRTPFMSWWNLTFLDYLLLSILLVFGCMFLMTLMTIILSMILRNTYLVFILSFIIMGLLVLLPTGIPRSSVLMTYAHFTPFTMMLGIKRWWMESGPFTTFEFYEVTTFSIWLGVFLLGTLLCLKRFQQQNL